MPVLPNFHETKRALSSRWRMGSDLNGVSTPYLAWRVANRQKIVFTIQSQSRSEA
jgi:hypothetical protein